MSESSTPTPDDPAELLRRFARITDATAAMVNIATTTFAHSAQALTRTVAERWEEAIRLGERIGSHPPLEPTITTLVDFRNATRVIIRWADAEADRLSQPPPAPPTDPPATSPAPPPTGASVNEGEKPPADSILPTLLSASDIANRIQRNRSSVGTFLRRFAGRNKDCFVENRSKRRNEPKYLYRTADVWPALEKWLKRQPGRLKHN